MLTSLRNSRPSISSLIIKKEATIWRFRPFSPLFHCSARALDSPRGIMSSCNRPSWISLLPFSFPLLTTGRMGSLFDNYDTAAGTLCSRRCWGYSVIFLRVNSGRFSWSSWAISGRYFLINEASVCIFLRSRWEEWLWYLVRAVSSSVKSYLHPILGVRVGALMLCWHRAIMRPLKNLSN